MPCLGCLIAWPGRVHVLHGWMGLRSRDACKDVGRSQLTPAYEGFLPPSMRTTCSSMHAVHAKGELESLSQVNFNTICVAKVYSHAAPIMMWE